MSDSEKTAEICLREMFNRVGEKYPNEELTNQDAWWRKHTWTIEEENDFKDWMIKFVKKRHPRWTKQTIHMEVGMFLLSWGWSYEDI